MVHLTRRCGENAVNNTALAIASVSLRPAVNSYSFTTPKALCGRGAGWASGTHTWRKKRGCNSRALLSMAGFSASPFLPSHNYVQSFVVTFTEVSGGKFVTRTPLAPSARSLLLGALLGPEGSCQEASHQLRYGDDL
jgi:hypothetical protein